MLISTSLGAAPDRVGRGSTGSGTATPSGSRSVTGPGVSGHPWTGPGRAGIAVAACALALALAGCGGGSAATATSSLPTAGASGGTAASAGATSTASSSPSLPATSGPAAAGSAQATHPDGQVYDETRDAKADVNAALALARTDGKRVLVDFGANWCPDCLVLDRLYRSATVAPLLGQRYHVVTVDIGRGEHNRDLSRRYGDVIVNGIPALVVLDSRGNVVTTTKDGSFANARTMTPAEVGGFLRRWGGTA